MTISRNMRSVAVVLSVLGMVLYGIVVLAEIILMPWAVDSTQKH